jgi:glycerol transport system ATP-binding protein
MEKARGMLTAADGMVSMPASGRLAGLADGIVTVAFRPDHLYLRRPKAEAIEVTARVAMTEITGSESFVHLSRDVSNWVAVLQGVHEYEPGQTLDAVLDPDNVFVFDAADRLVAAPGKASSSEGHRLSREENASKRSSA